MFGAATGRPHRAGGFLFVQNGGRGSTGIWRDVSRADAFENGSRDAAEMPDEPG